MADDQKSGDTLHMEKAESITKNGGENWEEEQYLRLIKELISEYEAGRKKIRMERTGVGTLSTFMRQFRYNLKGGRFPLLTTKRVFWRGVVEELLWFVKGSTNANELSEKEVKIWDLNASRSFLDSQGLHHRQQGDLGPVYGFQWRHAGAPYADMHTDYSGLGVDQLAEVIEQIRKNPMSRRLLVSSWNPKDVPLMALPPCHCLFQFYVDDEQALSLSMYQRSADLGLGVPFNIASYALLLRMVACLVGLEAGEFIHNTADTHIYSNHIEPLKQQLQRTPRDFPTLHIKRKVERIEDFVAEDFELLNYKPHPSIKMEMAV